METLTKIRINPIKILKKKSGIQKFRNKPIIRYAIIFFAILCIYYILHNKRSKHCNYQFIPNTTGIVFFENVLEAKVKPQPDRSIFHIVTSCIADGHITLNSRQACAIESAAKWNANRQIFILFASNVGFNSYEAPLPTLRALQQYPNIHFRRIDLQTYAINTPAQHWLGIDKVFSSEFFVSHLSDYLRFLTLYKFGGIYLDLDVIVLKSFNSLPLNFAGAESNEFVNVAVMGLESKYFGHVIAELILRQNTELYNPDNWNWNGPGAITRVLKRICGKKEIKDFYPETCLGFDVFPINTFYPISWSVWEEYFDMDPKIVNQSLDATKNSFTIHAWNKLSSERKIDKSKPKTAYGILAEANCPNVYRSSGLFF